MSKITIEFKIPQDQEEFNDAINGEAWHMVFRTSMNYCGESFRTKRNRMMV